MFKITWVDTETHTRKDLLVSTQLCLSIALRTLRADRKNRFIEARDKDGNLVQPEYIGRG